MAKMNHQNAEKSQFENFPKLNEAYPSLEDLIIGFSLTLHAKIAIDLELKNSTKTPKNETFFNKSHLVGYLNEDLKDIPSADQIFSFTSSLYNSAGLDEECLILTFIYILRVLKTSEIRIFSENWQIIVIAATLTSMRFTDAGGHFPSWLRFDDVLQLDSEFSRLMESKYEVNMSLFENCLEVLNYKKDEGTEKKWILNREKVNKIIRSSKIFDEKEEDGDIWIARSERIYNIDIEQCEFDN